MRSRQYVLAVVVVAACGDDGGTIPGAPSAEPDVASTQEDSELRIAASELLANDSQPDALTIESVGDAVGGTVALAGSDVVFTPAENFSGEASFTYTVTDGALAATGTVAIDVVPVADTPTLTLADVLGKQNHPISLGVTSELVDVDGSETLSVTLTNLPGGGVMTKDGVALATTTVPTGTFASRQLVTVGTAPKSVVVGDFNGDGKLDYANTNNTGNSITVALGDGLGEFALPITVPVTAAPFELTSGDFNDDGKLDLATVSAQNSGSPTTLTVLLGTGTGFTATSTEIQPGGLGQGIKAGDFNGDGKLDLAVSFLNDNKVEVLLGAGDGTFAAPSTAGTTGLAPKSFAIADLDGDGDLDVVVANNNTGNVSILRGDGTGALANGVNVAAAESPFAVDVGDFNGDGTLDLAVADLSGDEVAILLGDGAGSFGAPTAFPAGDGPFHLVVADLDGDGKLDVATTNAFGNSVSVLRGNGDGTFATKLDLPTGTNPFGIATGDFNTDGVPDLITTNNQQASTSLLFQNSTLSCTVTDPTGLTFTGLPTVTDSLGVFTIAVTTTATETANASTAALVMAFTLEMQPDVQ